MNRYLVITSLVVLLLTASACTVTGTASPPIVPPFAAASGTPGKPTATLMTKPAPTESQVNLLTKSCALLNSRDLASFFPSHTEVVLPKPEINQVDHPIFSTGNASGTETSCVYYAFHLPGSSKEIVLQANSWIDVPSPTVAASAWMQDWSGAKSKADQALSGVGDDAFYKDGRLSVKQGDVYITVEVTETDLDLNTTAGIIKQSAMEKQVALDILERLG